MMSIVSPFSLVTKPFWTPGEFLDQCRGLFFRVGLLVPLSKLPDLMNSMKMSPVSAPRFGGVARNEKRWQHEVAPCNSYAAMLCSSGFKNLSGSTQFETVDIAMCQDS